MKVTRFVALTSFLAWACVGTAYAAMTLPFGWYAEANVGESDANNKYYPGNVKRTGFGFNLNGGYKFNQFVAGEVGFSNFSATTVNNSAGAQAARDTHYSYDLAGKLMLPIGGTGAEFFGKLGVVRINSKLSENYTNAAVNNLSFNTGPHDATGMYMAAGADYGITPHLLGNLQWARSRGNSKTGNLNLYCAGLSYIF